VKGYDERLSGWAPDDIGFGLTAQALVSEPVRVDATVWHLWHEPSYERDHGWTQEKHDVKNAYLAAAGDREKILAVMEGKP
jgi:predicted glycosyltransferase involved in capsule biosynthesis